MMLLNLEQPKPKPQSTTAAPEPPPENLHDFPEYWDAYIKLANLRAELDLIEQRRRQAEASYYSGLQAAQLEPSPSLSAAVTRLESERREYEGKIRDAEKDLNAVASTCRNKICDYLGGEHRRLAPLVRVRLAELLSVVKAERDFRTDLDER